MRLLGIATGVAERPPLTEQVPAAVKLDLHVAQSLLIGLERLSSMLSDCSRDRSSCSSATRLSIRAVMLSSLMPQAYGSGSSRWWLTTSMLLPSGSNTYAA